MISYEEALEAILAECEPGESQCVGFGDALGLALASDVVAPFDLPRFDNSAVDGYGIAEEDRLEVAAGAPRALRLVGSIPAGKPASGVRVSKGEAVRLFTGSPIPEGVSAVVMQEDVESRNGRIELRPGVPCSHVRRRGEEAEKGAHLFSAGEVVTPALAAQLAGLGFAKATVYAPPSCGLVATGSELAPVGSVLREGQVYESNSVGIGLALKLLGVRTVETARVTDDAGATREVLGRLLESHAVVIATGGVSVGDYDFVKDALEGLGVQRRFWGVRMKPGKPVVFGALASGARQRLVFGLPGNPVSALVTFEMLVAPAIKKLLGRKPHRPTLLRAALGAAYARDAGRLEFVRVRLESGENGLTAYPLAKQGSHMAYGLALADGLMRVEPEVSTLPRGAPVTVHPLSWRWPA